MPRAAQLALMRMDGQEIAPFVAVFVLVCSDAILRKIAPYDVVMNIQQHVEVHTLCIKYDIT